MYKAALVIIACALVAVFAFGTAEVGSAAMQHRAAALEAAAQ